MSNFYASYPISGGGGGVPIYANIGSFPVSAPTGALGVASDTGTLYEWNGSSWVAIGSPGAALSVGTFDSGSASANGAHIDSNALIMQSASVTVPGLVNNTTQSLSGNKTFTGTISASNLSGTNTGDVTLGTANGLSIAGQVLSLQAADTTHTGALTSTDWNTFNNKQSALTIGNLTDVGTDGIIITGGTGAVIGSGTSISQHVADTTHNGYLSSTDWNTFNSKGIGSVTSVSVVSANGLAGTVATATTTPAITLSTTITGVLQGNGTSISAATTGNLTDAGTDGITITGGTSAVLGSGTSISQHVSDATHNGYLSSTDWNTFNSKQASGNYITALTGDITASGPGSVASTLATVNANVGSFGSSTSIPNFTVNAKGLITAASGNVVIAPAGTLTGTTLNSTIVTSSLTSVGTITSGTWTGTTIAIANGGTGQTSKAPAFDALSPMTTGGDIIYGGASGTATRLSNGSNGQVLTSSGGTSAPTWQTPSGIALSMIRLNTAGTTSAGYGSTNLSVRRFTTVDTNTGSDITLTQSSANGDSFTINTTGVYAISLTASLGVTQTVSITKNDTSYNNDIKDLATAFNNGNLSSMSWTGKLIATDVIRACTNNPGSYNASDFASWNFTIVRVL